MKYSIIGVFVIPSGGRNLKASRFLPLVEMTSEGAKITKGPRYER